ncbi:MULTISPECIES: DUF2975 domain-containing protein [unclassified Brevundimonas]|uniref:DUF2975 domain-containing protein n=1 Tax=unclassified Brevundimonas TaxID=2622653 RepID=UPI0025BF14D6|nr:MULTISPECIES: DUF2975 domain-containing protein [unclassified Brevundimonas]
MGLQTSFRSFFSRKRTPARSLDGQTGWTLPARALKLLIDIAFAISVALTLVFVIVFVIAIFIPLDKFSISVGDGGATRQMPLTRSLVLFVMGMVPIYLSGLVVILRALRQIFRTVLIGDPFQPANIVRLRLLGSVLAFVTLCGWGSRMLVANKLALGAVEAPGYGELITPALAIVITFTLAELFREGARLRHETELTI